LIFRDGKDAIRGSFKVIKKDKMTNIQAFSQLIAIKSSPFLDICHEEFIVINWTCNTYDGYSWIELYSFEEGLKRLLERIILMGPVFVFFK
jgi:hypothetical protein